MRLLKLLAVFYRTSIQTDMEYRADFFTRIVASLLGLGASIGALALAYGYTTNLRGWSFAEALVLLAIYYLVDGLIQVFVAPNMREISNHVRQGTLDFILIKPVSAQFLATFRTLNIWRVANVLVGVGLLAYTVARLGAAVGPGQAVGFSVTLLAGMVIVYSLWLFLVTLCFWFVRIDNIEQIVWQAFEAGRYPMGIYPRWLRAALTYVIPVSFMITVPARTLIGTAGLWWPVLAVALAALMATLSSAFWRYGLRNYTGASA